MTTSNKTEADRSDRDLAARCRRGEMVAFEELYRRHSGRLYTVACRITGSAADAEDLLQDVFLQAFRRIDSYRGEAALGTWLYRMAVNACLDHLRSRKGRERKVTDFIDDVESLEPVASPSWRPDRALDRIDLESAISRLPPSYRAAFVLHDVQGHEHHEVADMLGIAEGTSKSLLHKARLRLRAYLRGGSADEAVRVAAPADGVGSAGRRGTW
ncbi:MAG: RNA polymerase sigma factor [Acidobacteria bacterium]|nr:RNA polymerase sigma factor [Acidobacteriota bacterium]